MKKEKLETMSMKDLAESWGIDYQVFQIKKQLIESIKSTCEKEKISQRKLSSMVDGLTQDRISKIFSGQVGHMTIDKLVEIMSALNLKLDIKATRAKVAS